MQAPGWPASLAYGAVGVRPLRVRDAVAWSEVRVRNEQWLSPWEGSPPGLAAESWGERHSRTAFSATLRLLRKEARAGRCLPFAVTHEGRLVGQVTASGVVRGAFQSASLGYWVDGAVAGRGIAPVAVALVADHCLGPVGLHRVEANVRPENTASLRVVDKLGFRAEGTRRRMLLIDGRWADHLAFALTTEDVPDGVLSRYLAGLGDTPPDVHPRRSRPNYGQDPWAVG